MGCGYQCADLPAHEQVVCGEFLKGGISSVGFLRCDHAITNFTSSAQLLAAIAAGDLRLIEPVVGEIPAASPVEGTNPSGCGAATILDTFDRTIKITNYHVSDGNIDFINSLNKVKTHAVIYICGADKIRVILKPISWTVLDVTPANEREKLYFEITGKWTEMDAPAMYDAPVGVFNQE